MQALAVMGIPLSFWLVNRPLIDLGGLGLRHAIRWSTRRGASGGSDTPDTGAALGYEATTGGRNSAHVALPSSSRASLSPASFSRCPSGAAMYIIIRLFDGGGSS